MEAPAPLRGAQPLVDLQKLLADIFDNVLADFVQLSTAGHLDRESADQRKQRLLQHLHGTRQQLLRALALLNWKPWRVLNELVDHDRLLDIAARHVRTLGEVVGQMRQQAAGRIMAGSYLNMSDVNTALEVLTTGTYQELPSIILHRPPLFQPPPASLARQRSRLAHVTQMIRSRLVKVPLPPGLKVANISNGIVVLRAEGLYEAKLTLVPSEPLPGAEAAADGAAAGNGGEVSGGWAAAAAAAATSDPTAVAAAAQRWKWRLIHFVLLIGVPFYDPRQPGQILNTCNFHMVLAADNAAYLRKQRQAGGGAAAAAAAVAATVPSTLSDSATPAASSLGAAAASGAGGASASGGGGTLAAALRRSEADEVGAPLAVMHAILTDVAGRLLADELAAAAHALAAPGSRWHGHISVKPSVLLRPGVRIEYWVSEPPLMLPAGAPGEERRGVKPGPPFLELGMGKGGCVEVLHAPLSCRKPSSGSKLRLDTFRLNVEEVLMRAANMCAQAQLLQIRKELKAHLLEAMGKRAPVIRLTSLARQLWCRDGPAVQHPDDPAAGASGEHQHPHPHQQGEEEGEEDEAMNPEGDGVLPRSTQPTLRDPSSGGALAISSADDRGDGNGVTAPSNMDVDGAAAPPASAASGRVARESGSAALSEVSGLLARAGAPEETEGALVVLNAPVLEYLVSGTTELKIGKHLFSGRLTLRPGQDERDEGSLDHAATIAMNEDYVNQAARSAYNTAPPDAYPSHRALKEACAALCHVLQRTHTSTDATHFIQAARRAALHISRLPHGLLEAFTAASPGLAIEPRAREKVATWALQSLPFPPNFPPLEAPAPDTPPLRVPQCLTFFLQSRLSLLSPHVLTVVACSRQLVPLKVLSCIPVPSSAYRLPDQVRAAYMAVSTAASAATTALTSQQPDASGPHPVSPRAHSSRTGAPNGGPHEAAGPSPAASPMHDSPGGAATAAPSVTPLERLSDGAAALVPAAGGCSGFGSAIASGSAGCDPSGVGLDGSASGQPTAASPPLSNSRGLSSGTVASTAGTRQQRSIGGGNQNVGSGSGRGGGAGVSGTSRPTGQQVAVMLAQQQLSSVVRWCRRRMVWEVMLVQLAAVGAAFEELCNPPCQRLRVTRLAGTSLPCLIARRRGLAPARIGPTRLELELGPDVLAGQVTARLYGRFLCAPGCAPVDRHVAGVGTSGRCLGGGGGGGSGPLSAHGFVLDGEATAAAAAAAGAARSGGGGVSSRSRTLVCLRRRYCLERGDSALTLVQEVAAIIRVQTLLARLEMTAHAVTPDGTTTPSFAPAATSLSGHAAACGGLLRPQHLAVLTASSSTAGSATPYPPHLPARSQHQQQQGPMAASTPVRKYEDVKIKYEDVKIHPQHPQHPHQQQQQHLPLGAGGVGDGHGHSLSGLPVAKRIKTEPGLTTYESDVHGNGGWPPWQQQQQQQLSPPPQGHTGTPNGVAATSCAASGPATTGFPPGLRWHWPLVGTLTLTEYSCSAATLRIHPCLPQQQSPQTHHGGGPHSTPHPSGTSAPSPSTSPSLPPPPLQLHITWAPREVRHAHGGGIAAGGTTPPGAGAGGIIPGSPTTTTPSGLVAPAASPFAAVAPSPQPASPPQAHTPGGPAPASTTASAPSGLLPAECVVPTSRAVVIRPGEVFGQLFSDLVLCTVSSSSGHTLPAEYMHALEEFAEAGEEGKLLDAAAMAAWPLAGFCAALRPAVLARYGLTPDSDVRLTPHQPPYCHRIVARRRGAHSGPVLFDLVALAAGAPDAGRCYLKLSVQPAISGGHTTQQQQQPSQGGSDGGAPPARNSSNGAPPPATSAAGPAGVHIKPDPETGAATVLQHVAQAVVARLGARVHVAAGGRGAAGGVTSGWGPRSAAVPGPGAPLWLLLPWDVVQQAVELVFSLLG